MPVATVTVKLRAPFAPHEEWAELSVSDLQYGSVVGAASRASFSIRRNDPNAASAFQLGAMVSIERSDGNLTWAGYIRRRRLPVGDPDAKFELEDHAGGVILGRARTAIASAPLSMSSGGLITLALGEANARAEPPIDLEPPGGGGPPVTYAFRAETIAAFLNTMSSVTDWEWGLRHEVVGRGLRSQLLWRPELGTDRSQELWFEQGKHFIHAELVQDVEGFLNAALAVGGGGDFAGRAAAQVNVAGRSDGAINGHPLDDGGRGRRALTHSPALMGTRVLVEPQVTNEEALRAAARRLHDAPGYVREALTFTVAESEISDMALVELGGRYGVRFSDLDFGLGVERTIRILGLSLGTDGAIGVTASVEPEHA